jgi:predicted RNA binding protein YcfA (HicA-like mRNA interferase family)
MLKNITVEKFIRALERDGFVLKRTAGSHRTYKNSVTGRRVTLSYHHSGDTIRIGTLSSLINDAGWTKDDLIRLELIRRR